MQQPPKRVDKVLDVDEPSPPGEGGAAMTELFCPQCGARLRTHIRWGTVEVHCHRCRSTVEFMIKLLAPPPSKRRSRPSFYEAQDLLAGYKGSLADDIIAEREDRL